MPPQIRSHHPNIPQIPLSQPPPPHPMPRKPMQREHHRPRRGPKTMNLKITHRPIVPCRPDTRGPQPNCPENPPTQHRPGYQAAKAPTAPHGFEHRGRRTAKTHVRAMGIRGALPQSDRCTRAGFKVPRPPMSGEPSRRVLRFRGCAAPDVDRRVCRVLRFHAAQAPRYRSVRVASCGFALCSRRGAGVFEARRAVSCRVAAEAPEPSTPAFGVSGAEPLRATRVVKFTWRRMGKHICRRRLLK